MVGPLPEPRPPHPSPAPEPEPQPEPPTDAPLDSGPAQPADPDAPVTFSAADVQVTLTWSDFDDAAAVRILRDGVLVDEVVPQTGGYVDRGLWPATTFTYTVEVVGVGGAVTERHRQRVTTATTRAAHARLFADDAFVNRRIAPNARLAPNSAGIVERAIVRYAKTANFANSDAWGIPIVYADRGSPTYDVGCALYWCDVRFAPFSIPAGARPTTGSDHHLAVIDENGNELDMWLAERVDESWRAGTRWVTRADGSGVNCAPRQRCGSANAAGWALTAGVVRPEEIAQGRIEHALLLTTPYTRQGVKACPAIATDGRNADELALPMGARVQLDPAVDVDRLPVTGWKKVIARALQEYGAYVGDTGGSVAIRAEANIGRGYDAWAKAGLSANAPSLADLPWDRLRVLDYEAC